MKYKFNNLIKELPKNAIQKKIGVGVWCFLLLVYVSCRTVHLGFLTDIYIITGAHCWLFCQHAHNVN